MSATAAMVMQLRRMVAETDFETYSDSDLEDIIEQYPKIDSDGYFSDDTDWTATYDLNAAAAQIWSEKAALVAANFDFSADGATFQRSQEFEMATKMSAFYKSRRSISAIRMIQSPKETEDEDDLSN